MRLLKKAKQFFTDKDMRYVFLANLGLIIGDTDERYLCHKFQKITGYSLDLDTPKTFNEKLQWLKLYDRNPLYTTLVDKVAVKTYVEKVIGEEYIIPTIGIWDNPENIDFNLLPDQFVLKCNHNSGLGMCICKDKSKLDIAKARKELKRGLKQDYYRTGREWPYKNVPRKILCEKYLTDESGIELKDYKVFCFGGEPKLVQVDYNRFVEHKRNLYTTDWKYLEVAIEYPTDPTHQIERPKVLEEMLQLAEKLSKDIPHVRVDFYCIDRKIYFGEMTFYHGSGYEKFTPKEWGSIMGEWIDLNSLKSEA